MRIDLNSSAASQISSDQDTRQVASGGANKTAYIAQEDRTTLTSDSADVQSLVGVAMQSPDIRQDKVASLRQAVNSGQYKLDPAQIAGAILDEHA
ncbi:flagellar biosynthesis anti-sigma factor FlgM [Acidobacteria bacterium AB60]|nr:flagellar biosynthesis anti-sigma factor FlgM [Acidobacteria bacterium AB60]